MHNNPTKTYHTGPSPCLSSERIPKPPFHPSIPLILLHYLNFLNPALPNPSRKKSNNPNRHGEDIEAMLRIFDLIEQRVYALGLFSGSNGWMDGCMFVCLEGFVG